MKNNYAKIFLNGKENLSGVISYEVSSNAVFHTAHLLYVFLSWKMQFIKFDLCILHFFDYRYTVTRPTTLQINNRYEVFIMIRHFYIYLEMANPVVKTLIGINQLRQYFNVQHLLNTRDIFSIKNWNTYTI